jgi:hypothetical protein
MRHVFIYTLLPWILECKEWTKLLPPAASPVDGLDNLATKQRAAFDSIFDHTFEVVQDEQPLMVAVGTAGRASPPNQRHPSPVQPTRPGVLSQEDCTYSTGIAASTFRDQRSSRYCPFLITTCLVNDSIASKMMNEESLSSIDSSIRWCWVSRRRAVLL